MLALLGFSLRSPPVWPQEERPRLHPARPSCAAHLALGGGRKRSSVDAREHICGCASESCIAGSHIS